MNERRDAVVIGGGPAGATVALLLARAGWSVAVIEKKPFPRRKVCGEYISATTLPLLQHLGLDDDFDAAAGPAVRRVGLFAGGAVLEAALPAAGASWGRALGRETLDSLLLDAAGRAGADIVQPATVTGLARAGTSFCVAAVTAARQPIEFQSNIVVAAHGSWDVGTLPTQPRRLPARHSDLFGFKAHFRNCDLPPGLMPLLAFPGGYGGMVHADGGRVSLSCCIRRDWLARLSAGSSAAGEAVQAHMEATCFGVRRCLRGALRAGPWLAAGPIRPGIRVRNERGLFRVGNSAGEAHPVVAEGISMAMQSAWLLAQRLIAGRGRAGSMAVLERIGSEYEAAWRGAFAGRLRAARLIAHWAMRPRAVRALAPLLRRFPGLLTWGARASGKARRVVPAGA